MLKDYRIKHNLTQQQMADLLKIDYTTYSRLERHERNMTIELLTRFLEIRQYENDDKVLNVLNSI